MDEDQHSAEPERCPYEPVDSLGYPYQPVHRDYHPEFGGECNYYSIESNDGVGNPDFGPDDWFDYQHFDVGESVYCDDTDLADYRFGNPD